MVYSMKDIYSSSPTMQMTTIEQTIPEAPEEEHYINTETTVTKDGQLAVLNKNTIWGGILLLVIVLVICHFI